MEKGAYSWQNKRPVALYNDPASYVELILGKEVENYLKKITRYTPLSSLH